MLRDAGRPSLSTPGIEALIDDTADVRNRCLDRIESRGYVTGIGATTRLPRRKSRANRFNEKME